CARDGGYDGYSRFFDVW
nr:immunoglobulin heavy chain junction region [Mus musculus]